MYEATYALDCTALGLNHHQTDDTAALEDFHQITHLGFEQRVPVDCGYVVHADHDVGHTKIVAPSAVVGVGDTFASEIVGRGEANNLLAAGHKHGTSAAPEHFIQRVIESERSVDRACGF